VKTHPAFNRVLKAARKQLKRQQGSIDRADAEKLEARCAW
jgi:hypothetical protein